MTVRDLAHRLPDVAGLQRRCRAVAMLDAILSPDWESRYYTYTADWGGGVSAAEMRDGSGNDCFAVFAPAGGFIKGFDHEASVAPGVVDGLPDVFAEFLTEPAFADLDGNFHATFCLWRQPHDKRWRTAPSIALGSNGMDGAHQFLDLLTDPTPQSYRGVARSYFEVDADPVALAHVYDLRPLTDEVVHRLNPALTLCELADDIAIAGYPTSPT